MNRLIVPLALACLASGLSASAQSWEKLSGDSAVPDARAVAVRSQEDWSKVWAEHAGTSDAALPPVDFSREMVAAVFLGEKGTTGWTIDISSSAGGDPSRPVVVYRALAPERNQPVLQKITRPFAMLKMPLASSVGFQNLSSAKPAGAALRQDPAPETTARELAASKSRMGRFLDGEWYVSWGYNTETWAPVDIHIRQPSLGNDFTVHDVKAHDEPGWQENLLKKGITVPQYQFVIGRFVNKKKTVAVELNFDHTKYTSTNNQKARVSGVIDGKPVDEIRTLDPETFRYHLHNGANHVMANVVGRLPLIGRPERRLSVSGIAKAGVGIMLPHSDNTVLGQELDLGEKEPGNYLGKHSGWWQVDGWTAGLEAGVRVAVRPFYLEFTDKIAYSRMSDIPVYEGTAEHDLWMNQLSLSLGLTINGGKKKASLR